jgi:chaperonin GroES
VKLWFDMNWTARDTTFHCFIREWSILISLREFPVVWLAVRRSERPLLFKWKRQTGSPLHSWNPKIRNIGRFPFMSHPQPTLPARGEAKMTATSVTTTFTPLHDRILVRRVEEGEIVRGGIIIPDSAKEKPQEGRVIAVGKGKSNDEGKVFPLDVKSGDRVLFGKYSGTEIKIDNEDFLIMREEEVLGIVSK